MRYKEPLKQILTATRSTWDRPETRLAVRESFRRATLCRTPALGAEVYASDTEERVVYHTCKSPSCPSCGHRATLLWQREQWATLPDVPYAGVCFTMPDVLWSIFRENRHLLHDLPALGAEVIQQWVKLRYGIRVMIIVVTHTFGRRLNFNPHLHILTSVGGLLEVNGRWVGNVQYNKRALMHMWRYAVVTYLREALRAKLLSSTLSTSDLNIMFKAQYERWWSTHIDHFKSKEHFLRYAGRYVRRPPIAQHRFTEITDREVQFWTKDLKSKRRITTRYAIEEFVVMLAEHVRDRYCHAMRYFGLLAPRSKHQTSNALFLLLGQQKRGRPRRIGWASSLRHYFGRDPLTDSNGQRMRWRSRQDPIPVLG